MLEIHNRFKAQAEFFLVYVQEPHPSDGWQTESNVAEGVIYRQHQSFQEREEVANACSVALRLPFPVLIDEMDNAIDEAYGARPERLYVIGVDGAVAYRGDVGPFFFDLDEWAQALEDCVGR